MRILLVATLFAFSLHAGAGVRILETRGQWVRLALPGEQFQGWVPLEAIEAI